MIKQFEYNLTPSAAGKKEFDFEILIIRKSDGINTETDGDTIVISMSPEVVDRKRIHFAGPVEMSSFLKLLEGWFPYLNKEFKGSEVFFEKFKNMVSRLKDAGALYLDD